MVYEFIACTGSLLHHDGFTGEKIYFVRRREHWAINSIRIIDKNDWQLNSTKSETSREFLIVIKPRVARRVKCHLTLNLIYNPFITRRSFTTRHPLSSSRVRDNRGRYLSIVNRRFPWTEYINMDRRSSRYSCRRCSNQPKYRLCGFFFYL